MVGNEPQVTLTDVPPTCSALEECQPKQQSRNTNVGKEIQKQCSSFSFKKMKCPSHFFFGRKGRGILFILFLKKMSVDVFLLFFATCPKDCFCHDNQTVILKSVISKFSLHGKQCFWPSENQITYVRLRTFYTILSSILTVVADAHSQTSFHSLFRVYRTDR